MMLCAPPKRKSRKKRKAKKQNQSLVTGPGIKNVESTNSHQHDVSDVLKQEVKCNETNLRPKAIEKKQAIKSSHKNLIESHDQTDIHPESPTTFNLTILKKLERKLFAKGGNALCREMLTRDSQETAKEIAKHIQYFASKHSNQSNHVHALKTLKILNLSKTENIECDDAKTDEVFRKYGVRYEMTLDLDFHELVMKNENDSTFRNEIHCELASIIGVDSTLIHIESVDEGSIIITFILIAIHFKYIMLAAAAVGLVTGGTIRYVMRRRRNQRRQQLLRSGAYDIPPVVRGDKGVFVHKGVKYEAKVEAVIQNNRGHFVKVEYVGKVKPYWIQKTETLNLRDKRLHFKIEEEDRQTEGGLDIDSKAYFKYLHDQNPGQADLESMLQAMNRPAFNV